ncbi:hypothetical protein DyAD56_03520 [Dyella sp. AD56]|uniref:hypothetical protein n=1 Tax=Dyella sp. AD56 TaxID=1528744 RepID=UPI000C847308|nr:hypothetical protein [Dyella sp. AD56]PMQ06539.1 hypothetical protein DyAD56_03520 [Dyella sp. AD56]
MYHGFEGVGYLFSKFRLHDRLQTHITAMEREITSFDPNRLLNTAPADLAAYLKQKYGMEPIQLRRDEWHAVEKETKVDVRHDGFRRGIFDQSQPVLVPGQRIDVRIPFDGDADLFLAQGNTYSTNPPRASVDGSELVITFEFPSDSPPGDLRGSVDQTLNNIEQYLRWGREVLDPWNQRLEGVALAAIEQRRARILENQGRLSSLGIPVRAKTDAPKTYAVPDVRRKAIPTLPPATTTPFEPEPIWAMEHYEHALTVMQNMTLVMERSPSAFAKQSEEDLRDQFLFQLNGQFEGRATGETFNLHGKTDILLRENGKNVFIAECKFWKGPKKFSETIDQLLGYTSWRDTKTAILVFNRGTEPSTVLKGVAEAAQAHPNYKRTLPWSHESAFRYIFHHKDDANREFILSVLVFHVPK